MQDTRRVSCCSIVKAPQVQLSRLGLFIKYCCSVKRSHANGFKHQTPQSNATTKRYHQAQALMGATRLEAAEKCPDAGQGKLL